MDQSWTRYNGLQQRTCFITVFIAAPLSIATGLLQSSALSNRIGWNEKVLNRQAARSIHFISFSWFVFFIIVHGPMVFITSLRANTNHLFAGVDNASWVGFWPFVLAMGLVERPREFTLADLKAMPKQQQITEHFCIQGWTGVAEWGDVPMHDILDLVKPLPDARHAVVYSLAEGDEGAATTTCTRSPTCATA